MIQLIRKYSSSLIAKVLLVLVAASFALWGVEDMVRSATTDNTVAKVGDAEITKDHLYVSFQQQMRNLRQSLGDRIDYKQIEPVILESALQNLINQALYTTLAEDLGLVVSEKTLMDDIATNPTFFDDDGKFSRVAYFNTLRQAGLREEGFLEQMRIGFLQQYIAEVIQEGVVLPEISANTSYQYQYESRRFDLATIPFVSIAKESISQEDAKVFYADNPDFFRTPETRDVRYILLNINEIARSLDISHEDIQEYYQDNVTTYSTEEQRHLKQLLIRSEADAQAVYAKIQQGASLAEAGQSVEGVRVTDLGKQSRARMIPALADAAFALPQGGTSIPVKTTLGWHILQVEEVIPAVVTPFEDVQEQIGLQIAAQQAYDKLYSIGNELEEAITSGMPLSEAANRFGLEVRTLDALTSDGANSAGTVPEIFTSKPILRQTVFDSAMNQPSRLLDLGEGNAVIVEVTAITEATIKPYDVVENEAKTLLAAQQEQENANIQAQQLAEAVNADAAILKDVAAEQQYAIRTSSAIERTTALAASDPIEGIPAPLLKMLFDVPQNRAVYFQHENSYIVAKAVERRLPTVPEATPSVDTVRRQVHRDMRDDIQVLFERDLRRLYPVQVKQEAVATLLNLE